MKLRKRYVEKISWRFIKGSSHFINFKKTIKKIKAEGILYGAGIAD